MNSGFVVRGMKKTKNYIFDIIVIGSGMGGMTAASLLANDGYSTLVLEAAHMPGGCSSSYRRKGYIFETGATTLMGFDENQPLQILEEMLGITLPKKPINPSMTVLQNGEKIIRWADRNKWVEEAKKHFGEDVEQERFWRLAFRVSDVVWKLSSKNHFFPPTSLTDFFKLIRNDIADFGVLPYAFKSVKDVVLDIGITNPGFIKFLDEQLMISAQSVADDTPFLFGAPAATYTNYTNYYVPGGLINMVEKLQQLIEKKDGSLQTKEKVLSIEKKSGYYEVRTSKNNSYKARSVISNIPVWNMEEITHGDISRYFGSESLKYNHAWGAFTMGIVTDDPYSDDMTHHHQILLDENECIRELASDSLFISISDKNDNKRAPIGERVLNLSAHTKPEYWFNLNGNYDEKKLAVQQKIIEILREKLPSFSKANVKLVFSATPVTWNRWVYRKSGRVGGIPQSMMRSLFDWTPSETPFEGLYLCGDTVYPGQGIPGVTLSGINVYLRLKRNVNHKKVH